MDEHELEVERGRRFEFGKNWASFLRQLNDRRIAKAQESMCNLLGLPDLRGRRLLDIGSGSGLFSLAARRLGATVHSFDYDPHSVACTRYLKERFFADDARWKIERGSVLDEQYMRALGQFDLVYSWGVLHHTGAMWQAIDNASTAVQDGGLFCIAIYNDQGTWSRRWLKLKRIYNALPGFLRLPYMVVVMGARELLSLISHAIRLRPWRYVRQWFDYPDKSLRGMSYWHDMVDWIGGYPFEVAKPEQIFSFLKSRGFELVSFRTCGGELGCNEYVLKRVRARDNT